MRFAFWCSECGNYAANECRKAVFDRMLHNFSRNPDDYYKQFNHWKDCRAPVITVEIILEQ